jgi:MFS family permease
MPRRRRRADPAGRLRLLQGLALGGEYGGAATYVAEHAPDAQRGLYTSFIQTTATLGLFARCWWSSASRPRSARRLRGLGLAAALPRLDPAAGVSLWIRLQLDESPVFRR